MSVFWFLICIQLRLLMFWEDAYFPFKIKSKIIIPSLKKASLLFHGPLWAKEEGRERTEEAKKEYRKIKRAIFIIFIEFPRNRE